MRKQVIALAAALALGTVSTAAMAQHHGGGAGFAGGGGGGAVHMGGGGGAAMAHGNAGFSGGGGGGAALARPTGPSNFAGTRGTGTQANIAPRGNFAANGFVRDHDHDRFRHFRGGAGLFAFGGPLYDYDDYYADGCWQRRLVPTPFGWRWRLVDVCDY